MMGIVLFTTIRGLDFGQHWDEWKLIESANRSAEKGTLLPGWYNYPSFPHLVTLVSHKMEMLDGAIPTAQPQAEEAKQFLRGRFAFAFISVFAVLFLYLLSNELFGKPFLSLLAAGLFAFSWEWNYHIRWMAPDGLMVTFAMASVWLAARAYCRQWNVGWLLAAAAAGLAAGCKYTAGLILLPIGVGILLLHFKKSHPLSILLKIGQVVAIFLAVFLLTTPGLIMEFDQFLADIKYESDHYASGHRGHTTGGFFDHGTRMLMYFIVHVFSAHEWISYTVFLFMILGLFQVVMADKKKAIFFLCFPVLYGLFFSAQSVMLIRNYLILFPFATLLAACGVHWLIQQANSIFKESESTLKIATTSTIATALVTLVVINMGYAFYSANTIYDRTQVKQFNLALLEHFQDNPDRNFLVSRKIYDYFTRGQNIKFPSNVHSTEFAQLGMDYHVVFHNLDDRSDYYKHYKANIYDYVVRTIGPQEINFAYYPSWVNPRILIMEARYAKDIPLGF